MVDVAVVGLISRDIVVAVREVPPSGAAPVTERLEMLGGASNQAVALQQLGCSAGLLGVLGEDAAGAMVLAQARADGLDVSGVVHRPAATTPLVVGVVDENGTARLLEHRPPGTALTARDVRASAGLIEAARAVTVGADQPVEAVAATARAAHDAGALLVLDGGLADANLRREVVARGAVVRADDDEAAVLLGRRLDGVAATLDGARELVSAGASLVALAAGRDGNVLAWPDGHAVDPLLGGSPVDPTGGGDAFVAGLVVALLDGAGPRTAGWWASVAAAQTVARLGGRPALDRAEVAELAGRAAARTAAGG